MLKKVSFDSAANVWAKVDEGIIDVIYRGARDGPRMEHWTGMRSSFGFTRCFHDPSFDLRLCLPQGVGRPRSCHGFDLSQRLASGR